MANPQTPPAGEPRVGTYFLGRYRVVDEIGIGGMASVHLARMDGPGGFQKWVAIKRIHAHLVEDETFIQMFLDEARVAARISHPNVAQVFELGKHDDTYWIAMEYLHGEPLREVMRRTEETGQPMPPEIACRIIADAAEGLHAAHELLGKNGEKLNLVHRDVTPHNLFVTYDGTTKVVDFGIAKFSSRMANTRAGTLKGKLAYMSPEQVNGEAIDRRTDVFALGVVLWELTTNQRLFRMESDLDTLAKVQECNVPRPSTLVRGYPLDLEKIVMKALAKNRNERFKTAREFSRALQSLLMKRGLFIASDEVASYAQSIFVDRMHKRDAHLRWAAEVTQTISLDQLQGGVQEISSSSLASYESGPQAPRPAAGMPAPVAPARPAAGAPIPRPAAGMPVRPGTKPPSMVDSGETRALGKDRVQVAPPGQQEEIIEEDGPTLHRPPANDEPPTMIARPAAGEPPTVMRPAPQAGASVDDLDSFDEDKTIVTDAPPIEDPDPRMARQAPKPAAGMPPRPMTAPMPARPQPMQQPQPMAPQHQPPMPPAMRPAGFGQTMPLTGQEPPPPPSPFQPQAMMPTAPHAFAPQQQPQPFVPPPPQPQGPPNPSGPFPMVQPLPQPPPARRDQPTVTLQAARRGPPMWLVGLGSMVAMLLLLSIGYFIYSRVHAPSDVTADPNTPKNPTAPQGSGPFSLVRAGLASAIVPPPPTTDTNPNPTPTTTAATTDTAPVPTPTVVDTTPVPTTTATPAPTPTPRPTFALPTTTTTTPRPTATPVPTPVPTPVTTKPGPTPMGELTVVCFTTCDQVYDNGTPLGYPVTKKKVPVGMHKLKLVNGSVTKVITTTVEADRETKEKVSMTP